ncbi:hypothetical protein Tco_0820514 [Tanacetum coccineum]|uniref:Uncharacterized protein n=1 Tax=Tanacetum coccineum TaxID=301880 RepID=A0ABQ5A9M8_9ASTR
MSNSNTICNSSTECSIHNAILEAGSKDRHHDNHRKLRQCPYLLLNYNQKSKGLGDTMLSRVKAETVSYHKLYDILKQHQNEVNEIRTERLARTANPLALVAQQQPIYLLQIHLLKHLNIPPPDRTDPYQNTRHKQFRYIFCSYLRSRTSTFTEDDESSKEKERLTNCKALIFPLVQESYKPYQQQPPNIIKHQRA